METPKTSSLILIKDLRQSPKWASYLSWLGWKSFITSSGVSIEIMPTKLGGFVKIQRPQALNEEDVKEIEKVCVENKALFIKIEPYINQDIPVLENAGYGISYSPLSPPSTIYIDLTLPEETLWKNITKSGRYSIRHAEANTMFYQNPSEDLLKKFYEIALETSKAQKFIIQSFDDLKKKVEVFAENSYLALGYNQKGELVGGKFFLTYDSTVWYLHAGTSSIGRQQDSGHKMMWDSFLYFKNLGFKVMDLDGIDDKRFPNFTKNWGGFSFFKEKFGGNVIRFPAGRIKYLHPFFKFMSKITVLPL